MSAQYHSTPDAPAIGNYCQFIDLFLLVFACIFPANKMCFYCCCICAGGWGWGLRAHLFRWRFDSLRK